MSHTIPMTQNRIRWGDKGRIVLALAVKDITDGIKNKTILSLIVSMFFVVLMFRFLPLINQGSEMNVVVFSESASTIVQNAILDSDQLELWEGYESVAQMQRRLAEAETTEIGLVIPADLDEQLAQGDRPVITAYVPYFITNDEAQTAQQLVEEELAFWTGSEVTLDLQSNPVYMDMESHGAAVPLITTMIYALTLVGIILVPNLMVEEKKEKTMEALLVSPASPGLITAGKALAGLFYALIAGGIVLAFYVPIILNWPLAILALLVGSLCAVALGLVLGTRFDNGQQLLIVAWVFIAPLMLGYFLSLESRFFPEIVGQILAWLPSVSFSRLLMVSMVPVMPWLSWVIDLAFLCALTLILAAIVMRMLRRLDR